MRAGALASVVAACGGSDPTGNQTQNGEPVTFGVGNRRIVGVQLSQAIQTSDGSIPLVAGRPTVVTVLIGTTRPTGSGLPVVMRLLRGSTLLRADTVRSSVLTDDAPVIGVPSAQFLVPDSLLRNDVSWQVELDPAQAIPDSIRSDNRFPRLAPALFSTVAVPAMKLRFVPIILSSHDNRAGSLTPASLEVLMRTVRQILPTGPIITSIGTPLVTPAFYGSGTTGGGPAFWGRVLSDIDLARVTSTEPDAYWYGVVLPPAGATFIQNGGFGYIPTDARATGPSTRTAAGVQPGWFNNVTAAGDLLAHELGHNFGRSHSPACDAAAPLDPLYPRPDGGIGDIGFDAWSWVGSGSFRPAQLAVGAADVMGYCFPVWISAYTYRGIYQWRQATSPVVTRLARAPGVLIAGSISASGQLAVRPAVNRDVVIPASDPSGDVQIELTDADGRMTGTTRVRSVALDHGDGERHFIAILPAAQATTATRVLARAAQSAVSLSIRSGSRAAP
jgi:hypothetical protein